LIKTLDYDGNAFIFLNDGRLAFGSLDQSEINIYDIERNETTLISLASYGNLMAMTQLSNGLLVSFDSGLNINVWNVTNRDEPLVYSTNTNNNSVYHVDAQQVGDHLATCDANGNFYLWNMNENSLFEIIKNPIAQQDCTMTALNDNYLIMASGDGYLQLWSILNTFTCLSTFTAFQTAGINSMRLISNNTLALTANTDHVLIVQIDVVSCKFHVTKAIPTSYPDVKSVALVNSTILLTGDCAMLRAYNLSAFNSLESFSFGNSSTCIQHLAATGKRF
jgi:WD40 repeat protein